MYLAVVITIEFATFHNASANASAASPKRSQKTRGTPSPTQPQKANTQVMNHWHYAEIYDFGLVDQHHFERHPRIAKLLPQSRHSAAPQAVGALNKNVRPHSHPRSDVNVPSGACLIQRNSKTSTRTSTKCNLNTSSRSTSLTWTVPRLGWGILARTPYRAWTVPGLFWGVMARTISRKEKCLILSLLILPE